MRILFTGASSFTGLWFARELAERGHTVVTPFLRQPQSYTGIRQERIQQLLPHVTPAWECPFGSDAFLELVGQHGPWDLICHHASDVTDYKSPAFDPVNALSKNTHRLTEVLQGLKEQSCSRFLWTGSVFEANEGQGSDQLRAVSPYGLSKGLTSQLLHYYVQQHGLHFGKFVVANPFGPFEEERFTYYLMKNWLTGQTPIVSSPAYIRDNVPVSLMAKAYADFAEKLPAMTGNSKVNPSFYAESQGDFTKRFAQEMEKRLSCACDFVLKEQTDFPEPRDRINLDKIDATRYKWSESLAWDELAHYYTARFPVCAQR